MVQIKTGTQYLLPVRLLNTSNVPVTGITYNQVTATAYYEDGSSASISPSASSSWTELSSGAYLLKLASGSNTVVGALTVVVTVSGSQDFVGVYDVVGNLAADIYTLIGTPPGGFTTVFGVLGTPVHGSLAQDIAAGSGGSSVPPNPMIDVGIFKQSSSPRILVRLLSSAGAPVTGVAYTAVTVSAVDGAGTTTSPTVTSGSWVEITTGVFANQGVYQLNTIVPTATEGTYILIVAATGAQDYIGTYVVSAALWDDIYTRIGAPVSSSISGDIQNVQTTSNNIYSRLGAPFGASIAADIGASASFSGTIGGDTADIYSRIGAPHGASISADIGAAGSHTGTIGGDTSFIYTSVGSNLGTNVTAISTLIGTAPGGSYTTVFHVLGTPFAASTGLAGDIGASASHTGSIGGDTAYLYTSTGTILTDVGYIGTPPGGFSSIFGVLGTPIHGSVSLDIANISGAITGVPPYAMPYIGIFKQSTSPDVLVRLVSSTGLPVTGITFSGVTAAYVDGSGASGTITLSSAANWTEITTGQFSGQGIYQLKGVVPTGTEGTYIIIVSATGSVDFVAQYTVSTSLWDDIFNRVGAPFGATIAADIGASSSHSGTIGGDTSAIYTIASTIQTRLGTPPGGSYNTVFQVLGTPASPSAGLAGDIAAISGSVAGNIPKNNSSNLTFAASQNFNLIVQLLSSTGTPVPGIAYNTSGFHVYLVDGAGSISTVSTTAINWVELGGVFAGSGTYQLKTQSIGNIGNALFQFIAPGSVNTNLLVNIVTYQPYDDYQATAAILGVPVTTVSGDIAAIQTKLGTPAAGTVSTDIANVQATANNIYTSTGAGLATTVNAIHTSVGSGLGANVSSILADIGTSPGGSYGTIFANLVALRKVTTNRWKVITTGPGANTMVFYDDDQVTPLFTFNLYDSSGVPTSLNPFERHP